MSRRVILRALALAVALPSTGAWAQASPSAGTSAARFDLMRREVGTISPDPDGAGGLTFLATRKTYDAAGHLVKVESGVLYTWHGETVAPANWTGFTVVSQVDTTYDPMGRKVREAMSGSGVTAGVTEYGYDLAGRLKCTAVRMNPDVWATPLGDKCVPGTVHSTHGPDRITRNHYNAQGELLKVEKAAGTGIAQVYAAYTYSPNGKQTSVTDANGNRAEMTYDGLDRQKRWIFPSKTAPGSADPADYEEYGYDANASKTSLRKRDGSTLTYQYDALNRMSVKIVPERSGLAATHTRDVHYEYDNRGLQTKARFDSLAGEGITNVYDGFGLLVSSTSDMGGTARSVGNLYDLNGNRIRVTHPDGAFFTYDLDGLDRPIWIRENGGSPVTQLFYDWAGRRASSAWGMTTYAYDPVGRLQTLSHNPVGTSRDHDIGFTYNPASQVQTRSASNDAYAWTPPANYVRTYGVNGLNQYTATNTSGAPVAYSYDPNGNLTADGSHGFVYDVENRLVSATGAHNAELAYDPLGRLFQVTSGAGVRRLVYDGDALIAEYDSGGGMPHRYIHGNDPGADDPVAWYDNYAYGWRRILFHDHQGSIVQVADMYGNPFATNSYDPWGIPGSSNQGRFGYTGQTWLPELGMWYYKARVYSPVLGRFLQVDPVGYKDQMNLYAYVGNDPVNSTDPTGRTILLRGEDPNRKKFIDQAYRLTGVRLRQGAGGRLEQVGKRDSKVGFREAANTLTKALNSTATINVNAVSNDPSIGDALPKFDVGDIETFENASSRFAAAIFAHILEEGKVFAESDDPVPAIAARDGHKAALRVENRIMGADRRDNPWAYQAIRFDYFRGTERVASYSFPESEVGPRPGF